MFPSWALGFSRARRNRVLSIHCSISMVFWLEYLASSALEKSNPYLHIIAHCARVMSPWQPVGRHRSLSGLTHVRHCHSPPLANETSAPHPVSNSVKGFGSCDRVSKQILRFLLGAQVTIDNSQLKIISPCAGDPAWALFHQTFHNFCFPCSYQFLL